MDGATIQEITELRAEFHKELSALREEVRLLRAIHHRGHAELVVELETIRKDFEWLEQCHEQVIFEGPKAAVSQKLDAMLERVH
jgi:hypothetical protein